MGKRKHNKDYYEEKIRKLRKKIRKISSPSPSRARTPSLKRSSLHSPSTEMLVTSPHATPEHTQTSPQADIRPPAYALSACDIMDCGPSSAAVNVDQLPSNTGVCILYLSLKYLHQFNVGNYNLLPTLG